MFSQRLKYLRKEKKLTQNDMAELLGITRQGYAKYESGSGEPDIKAIDKLANFFNVTTDYLLGRSDIKNPEKMTNEGISNEDYEKLTAYQKEVVDFIISRENLFFYDQPQKILDALEEFEMFYEFTKKRDQNKKD
ncbi:helix-turn-helix domain-containing protein [Kurthia sp. Dielmo]|uniref:helix-turn-helix domain-containing protein n=1 Tax=Kurthia sp. Dielmo TaxID=1033738 RepID=UPI001121CAD9|nr:helix-turn-helix transcriptional regulator [Kurthia sp. Dielmo]